MKVPFIMCKLHPYNWKYLEYTGHDMTSFLQKHNLKCLEMYFHVYNKFLEDNYIGPCLFIPA
jgi:hypothetical protein